MEAHGSISQAAVAFGAAAMGAVGAWIGDAMPGPALYGSGPHWPATPDELYAWAKAIGNSVFFLVNSGVGAWNVIKLCRPKRPRPEHARPRRSRDTPPAGPAPHTEPTGGANESPGK